MAEPKAIPRKRRTREHIIADLSVNHVASRPVNRTPSAWTNWEQERLSRNRMRFRRTAG